LKNRKGQKIGTPHRTGKGGGERLLGAWRQKQGGELTNEARSGRKLVSEGRGTKREWDEERDKKRIRCGRLMSARRGEKGRDSGGGQQGNEKRSEEKREGWGRTGKRGEESGSRAPEEGLPAVE